jgi:hypothetical protein
MILPTTGKKELPSLLTLQIYKMLRTSSMISKKILTRRNLTSKILLLKVKRPEIMKLLLKSKLVLVMKEPMLKIFLIKFMTRMMMLILLKRKWVNVKLLSISQ